MSEHGLLCAVFAVVKVISDVYDPHRRESVLIVKQADSQAIIADWGSHHADVSESRASA
jgi:hypothetical protein